MKALALIAALALLLIPMSASAQSETLPEQFIDFQELLIDGEAVHPMGHYANARTKAEFSSSLKLERSFMGEIQESGQDEALSD